MMQILGALMPNILGTVNEVVDRLVPDKAGAEKLKAETAARLEEKMLDGSIQGALAQIEVNKIEAQSSSLFVAGWRPFIGWVCGSGLFYQYLLSPILPWVVNAFGGHVAPMPTLDGSLSELVTAMLGLGLLRSFEKYSKVAR
jgi:hypothetical protein